MLAHSLVRIFVFLAVVSMTLALPIPKAHRKSKSEDFSQDPPTSPTGASGKGTATPPDASVPDASVPNASVADVSLPDASFAADPSIDVASILSAVNAATSNPVSDALFGIGKNDIQAQIYGLNTESSGSLVFAFTADMDVDCDGVDYQCEGNPDGQSETSYGALAATKVPFYVLPQSFVDKQKIKGNSLGAIICNNKMYYAIMGDTNGDSPEVIGEASILLAQTCFPDDGLNGGKGHDAPDVTYIVFGSLVPGGVEESSPTIDVNALKTLGDSTMAAFKLAS